MSRAEPMGRGLRLLLLAGLVAIWQGLAPPAAAQVVDATAPVQPPLALPPVAPGPLAGLAPSVLSLYKTLTYTTAVLTTDQLWYMGTAAQAGTTGGWFGVVNVVTSPMLTYAFEYTWERCCEAPPGPDGVRPVDARKAVIYRAISTARIFGLTLAFGNGLGSSLLTTAGIAATRTAVYMGNDLLWNRLTGRGRAAPAAPPQPQPAPAQIAHAHQDAAAPLLR